MLDCSVCCCKNQEKVLPALHPTSQGRGSTWVHPTFFWPYSFTDPSITPFIKYFWQKGYTHRIGTVLTMMVA